MNVETCPFIKVEDFLLEIFQICLGPRPSLKENNIADFFRYFQKCQKFDVRRRQFPEKGLRVSVFPLHMVDGEDEVDDDTHPVALSLHHPHPCNFHTQQIPLGIQCTNWGELDVALICPQMANWP